LSFSERVHIEMASLVAGAGGFSRRLSFMRTWT
jgi:hypothetical protein